MDNSQAALYERPFKYVMDEVKPERDRNRNEKVRDTWWRHEAPRPRMWEALEDLSRYIATPRVAKYRLFVWCDVRICPDCQLIVIARDDDTSFGILHSRFHEAWSLRLCTWLGKGNDPRYTPTTTFQPYPFPPGLSPDIPAADYANDTARRRHRRSRPPAGGTPRPLAQPTRMGRVGRRTCSGLSQASRSPRRSRRQ